MGPDPSGSPFLTKKKKVYYLGSGGRPALAFYIFSLVKSLKWLYQKRKVIQTWEVVFFFQKEFSENL